MLGQEVIKQLLFNDVKNIVGVFNQNKNRIEQKINYLNINEIHQLKNDFDVVYLISAYIPKDTIERDKLFKVNVQLVQEISSKFTNSKIIVFIFPLYKLQKYFGDSNLKNVGTPKKITGLQFLKGLRPRDSLNHFGYCKNAFILHFNSIFIELLFLL